MLDLHVMYSWYSMCPHVLVRIEIMTNINFNVMLLNLNWIVFISPKY